MLSGCWQGGQLPINESPTYLTKLTPEQLLDVEVISVSKRAEDLSKAAAAAYVITSDEIRRTGATTLADALRGAPGIEVANLDASIWAITSRGFNGPFANKLLVMIDGRNVYTPLFSGTFWDVQDVPVDDVERIEVIRGPGAMLWGANAVNGVINILTKSGRETPGLLAGGGWGTEEKGFGSIRYGARLGENLWYRAYGKFFTRDRFVDQSGRDAADGWKVLRGGFRLDWDAGTRGELTLQAHAYDGTAGHTFVVASVDSPLSQTLGLDSDVAGAVAQARWKRRFSDTSEMTWQFYVDWTDRLVGLFQESRTTYDSDFQHQFGLSDRQNIIWGLGYRFSTDEIVNTKTFDFDPKSRDIHLFSGFAQDEVALVRNLMSLRFGSKFEQSSFTGFEIQPSIRFLWTPTADQTMWSAVSHAVRTPSRSETDLTWLVQSYPTGALFPGSPPVAVRLVGNPAFDSEKLTAYEMGYRVRPAQRLAFDLATFYNVYKDLRTVRAGAPILVQDGPPHFDVPFRAENTLKGKTWGFELVADWQPESRFRLRAAYTFLRVNLKDGNSIANPISDKEEWLSPRHQFALTSLCEAAGGLECGARLRYVDKLPALVDRYVTMDMRIGWKPVSYVELSVIGQNLFDDHHLEFVPLLRNNFDNQLQSLLVPNQEPVLFDILSTSVQRSVRFSISLRL